MGIELANCLEFLKVIDLVRMMDYLLMVNLLEFWMGVMMESLVLCMQYSSEIVKKYVGIDLGLVADIYST